MPCSVLSRDNTSTSSIHHDCGGTYEVWPSKEIEHTASKITPKSNRSLKHCYDFPIHEKTLHWTWICRSAISCSWLKFTVMHYWLSRLNVQCSFQLQRFQGKWRTFRWKRILHFWSLITKYKLAVSACNQNYAGKTKQGHINIQFLMLLFSIVWKAKKVTLPNKCYVFQIKEMPHKKDVLL